MAQFKILLDTNSYLRLAKSIHPLLSIPFGTENYCLYVLKDLDIEYGRNQRLQTKFTWVTDPDYQENRKKQLTLSRAQKKEIQLAEGYIWEHVLSTVRGPSKIDCKALAHGYVLNIPVVTDDRDMQTLASEFSLTIMGTLDLMDRMLQCGHIDRPKVRAIAAYWQYEKDVPRDFAFDFQRIFGEDPPYHDGSDSSAGQS